MNPSNMQQLNDQQLVEQVIGSSPVSRLLIDEYYRRCIPYYLDFLGTHWHTGFYRTDGSSSSALDQVRMVDHIAKLAGLTASTTTKLRVLDVGCGVGAAAVHLKKRFNLEMHALTPVPEQQRLALQLAKHKQIDITAHIGHAEDLPFAGNHFDIILFFESPCHFNNKQAFFNQAYRTLKPGGVLAGEDWLATDKTQSEHQRQITEICRTWAIPELGSHSHYLDYIKRGGFTGAEFTDMRDLCDLEKGFCTTKQQQAELELEIKQCQQPIWKLTLQGMLALGKAFSSGSFTVGQFKAFKPKLS